MCEHFRASFSLIRGRYEATTETRLATLANGKRFALPYCYVMWYVGRKDLYDNPACWPDSKENQDADTMFPGSGGDTPNNLRLKRK